MPTGKRGKPDHMSVATGQMRLFGNEVQGADLTNNETKKAGKRVIHNRP